MAKPNSDHVVMDGKTGELCCLHCTRTYKVHLPIHLDDLMALAESFRKRHQKCKPAPDADKSGE